MKQPLVEAMEHYLQEHVYPLHTPGHKGGRGMAEPLRSLLGSSALCMDVSLMSELDDIHAPCGCIRLAQEEAAGLYGSDACFFSVNGTTGAVHAMLLTALQPGDRVLIPRNAHRSVMGGLVLADAAPVYVQPSCINGFGLQGQVTPEQVKEMRENDKALFEMQQKVDGARREGQQEGYEQGVNDGVDAAFGG